jgi:hypothetical protein
MALITVVLAILAAAMSFGSSYWYLSLANRFIQVLADTGADIPTVGSLLYPARQTIGVGMAFIGFFMILKEFLSRNMAFRAAISIGGFIIAFVMYYCAYVGFYQPAIQIKFALKHDKARKAAIERTVPTKPVAEVPAAPAEPAKSAVEAPAAVP